MRDGRRLQVKVQRVEVDAIVSMENVRYARADVAHLQRRRFSGWKTALAVTGAALGAVAAAGILVGGAVAVLW